MNTRLDKAKDPMGLAIHDFHHTGKAKKLIVHSSMFDDDEIPVATLFRKFKDMPYLEQVALKKAEGAILDVGAGSGCHCLALAELGKRCTAIDISELSVEVMKEKGIDARCINLYDETFVGQYDTILMLMNGTGIIGRLENMQNFFMRIKHLLAPGGRILIDSSDLSYLFEEEDGSIMIDLADEYYGLVDFQMEYNGVLGEPFDWLYVDFDTLSHYAEQNGFKAELVAEGEHYDYLASLTIA
jgi:SAM-dependent methyltransferase